MKTGARQALYAVGVLSSDTNGVQDTTTFGSGAGLIDELPDANGATFANTAAQTFAETEPDGTTVARTVKADGTYTEADSYFGLTPASTTQTNADLSATLTYFGGLTVDVAYGAPSGTGASATIPYSISLTIPSPPPATTGTIPDWYPATTIFSDTAVKSTGQTIPSACNVSSAVGTSATKIVETTTHLDTALGTYETRVQTSFDAPGFGSVCVQLADTIDAYYDYTGQSLSTVFPGLNLALSATPIQIDTLSETLGFTTGSIQGSSSNRRSGSLASDSVMRAVSPVFDRAVQSIYRARRKAMVANLTSRKAALLKEIVR
ncbi:MAG: hypothetical protein IAI49_11475 [Candidatus Eremiobacteraeota bacterium]|nr:hypothetical protein [Candidatus Eremiobacteraeota bacterium]